MLFDLTQLPRRSKLEVTKDRIGLTVSLRWTNKEGQPFVRIVNPDQKRLEDRGYFAELVESMVCSIQQENANCEQKNADFFDVGSF